MAPTEQHCNTVNKTASQATVLSTEVHKAVEANAMVSHAAALSTDAQSTVQVNDNEMALQAVVLSTEAHSSTAVGKNVKQNTINYAKRVPRDWKLDAADCDWIGKQLFQSEARLKDQLFLWYDPPQVVNRDVPQKPTSHRYFRHRLCLWAPLRLFTWQFKCPQVCTMKL